MANLTVVDRVVDNIIQQVINGQLTPGDRVPTEPELCEQLGAGRNSVREAIKKLEAYGVVQIRRADGTYISETYDQRLLDPILYHLILQKHSWNDFVQVRRVIETGTMYVLIQQPEADLAPLREALRQLKAELDQPCPNADAVQTLDTIFHTAITEAVGNPQLCSISEYITRITMPSRTITVQQILDAGQKEQLYTLHQQMLDVIERRDLRGIDEAIQAHYSYWAKAGAHLVAGRG